MVDSLPLLLSYVCSRSASRSRCCAIGSMTSTSSSTGRKLLAVATAFVAAGYITLRWS